MTLFITKVQAEAAAISTCLTNNDLGFDEDFGSGNYVIETEIDVDDEDEFKEEVAEEMDVRESKLTYSAT
jgi:hypothetical protein